MISQEKIRELVMQVPITKDNQGVALIRMVTFLTTKEEQNEDQR